MARYLLIERPNKSIDVVGDNGILIREMDPFDFGHFLYNRMCDGEEIAGVVYVGLSSQPRTVH
jgi:hypothetical protein